MKKTWVLATIATLVSSASAYAETSVTIGMSGWTGFAPLTLAKEAGIFEKNGLKVDIKKIPQASRHLALASGDIQCAATTVETWIAWNANGVKSTQIFQMDKSHGADGIAVRSDVSKVTDLKGKDDCRFRARHVALFLPCLDSQGKRTDAEGCKGRQS